MSLPLSLPPLAAPWRDRQGSFSPFKLAVLAALFVPGLWLAAQATQGQLGGRPIMEAIHFSGLWAVRILWLSLLVTPARQLLRWPKLMLVRRMVGLGALAYALLHLVLYAADLKWDLVRLVSEIALRIYLTIGFLALLGLAVLGVTSTDGWVKRLGGRRWAALHRVVYGLAALAVVHFALQSKIDVTEAVLMAGLLLWLLGYRLLAPKGGAPGLGRLALLGIGAAVGTALIEAAWYGVATGVPPLPVLEANLDVEFGLRPALWVGIAAAGMLALRVARGSGSRKKKARAGE
ncbi:sulfite oxidase heme-binding subunit YedZ [Roseomonas sp. USHLN139]|uniref:sulfite oxidase heme-binding subunit YedZ n=1 Tax=Roseomonas sp. USHLN139 TaxID=3081298 RepID=UPI003B02D8D9